MALGYWLLCHQTLNAVSAGSLTGSIGTAPRAIIAALAVRILRHSHTSIHTRHASSLQDLPALTSRRQHASSLEWHWEHFEGLLAVGPACRSA